VYSGANMMNFPDSELDKYDNLFGKSLFKESNGKSLKNSGNSSNRKALGELRSNTLPTTPKDRRNYYYNQVNEEEKVIQKKSSFGQVGPELEQKLAGAKVIIISQSKTIQQLQKEVSFLKLALEKTAYSGLHGHSPPSSSSKRIPVRQTEQHLSTPKKRKLEEEQHEIQNEEEEIFQRLTPSNGKPPLYKSPTRSMKTIPSANNTPRKDDKCRIETPQGTLPVSPLSSSNHLKSPKPEKESENTSSVPGKSINFSDLERLLDGFEDFIPSDKNEEFKKRRDGLKHAQTVLMNQKLNSHNPHVSTPVKTVTSTVDNSAKEENIISPRKASLSAATSSSPSVGSSQIPSFPVSSQARDEPVRSPSFSGATSYQKKFSEPYLSNIVKQHGPVSIAGLPAYKEKFSSWKTKYNV
jgi:hypothetical protein